MFARTSTLQLQSGKIEEAASLFRDSVIPAARQQKGFQGSLWLKDTNSEKVTAITLWETEADMKSGEASGYYKEQLTKFTALVAGSPVREVYEAEVQF